LANLPFFAPQGLQHTGQPGIWLGEHTIGSLSCAKFHPNRWTGWIWDLWVHQKFKIWDVQLSWRLCSDSAMVGWLRGTAV